ncbi:MAG: GNAT family N-acetyltransferase [Lachnospiraceae bacterium]|nr:GNAT family N-acetyltransferase [Lachnospiraceae bacterium]
MQKLSIQHCTMDDWDEILKIYEDARLFMAEHGNPDQWGHSYPPKKIIRRDIEKEQLYRCVLEDGRTAGLFWMSINEDTVFDELQEGSWPDDGPHATVGRIAANGIGRGVAGFCLDWAFSQSGSVRIYTHPQNTIMRSILEKHGFVHCGRVRSSVLLAYQRCCRKPQTAAASDCQDA